MLECEGCGWQCIHTLLVGLLIVCKKYGVDLSFVLSIGFQSREIRQKGCRVILVGEYVLGSLGIGL